MGRSFRLSTQVCFVAGFISFLDSAVIVHERKFGHAVLSRRVRAVVVSVSFAMLHIRRDPHTPSLSLPLCQMFGSMTCSGRTEIGTRSYGCHQRRNTYEYRRSDGSKDAVQNSSVIVRSRDGTEADSSYEKWHLISRANSPTIGRPKSTAGRQTDCVGRLTPALSFRGMAGLVPATASAGTPFSTAFIRSVRRRIEMGSFVRSRGAAVCAQTPSASGVGVGTSAATAIAVDASGSYDVYISYALPVLLSFYFRSHLACTVPSKVGGHNSFPGFSRRLFRPVSVPVSILVRLLLYMPPSANMGAFPVSSWIVLFSLLGAKSVTPASSSTLS